MQKEDLMTAARIVDAQAMENPNLGIPADPEVADFMGAFEEKAVTLADLEESQGEGEVSNGL